MSKKSAENNIGSNKKALHDYFIADTVESGLALAGWEVKSLRAGKLQLRDSYVVFYNNEAWLTGAHISPLVHASTHVVCDPVRDRKLLLKRKEIERLARAAEQDGHTVVCLNLYWKGSLVKAKIAVGKGKKQHDKRATEKEREWNREKERLMKHKV